MNRSALFAPRSLARRFALAAAGLAAGVLLATSLAAWWLIDRQHDQALEELAARERQTHAAAVSSQLHALAGRMSEVAGSTILATGLVDSAGRETYLAPFLGAIRHINGVPVQVLFTDFEGREIASNSGAHFTEAQLEWLRRELDAGRRNSAVFPSPQGAELVALEPLIYARTRSPEGGLLYKVFLKDIHAGERMRLEWADGALGAEAGPAMDVPVPAVFAPLQFRVRGAQLSELSATRLAPQYLAAFAAALILFTAVVVAGLVLARFLTRDLHRLEVFSSRVVRRGLSGERAPLAGTAEVASLAASINEMLDRLHEQHSVLLREREKLSELADALKAGDQRKDEFLAMLAHELRNPLAPITHSLELMKRTAGDERLALQARGTIERQVRQLVRLVDDLLDVGRITRGRLELRKERVELAAILEQAVESCRSHIDAAGHALSVSMPSRPLFLEADPVRLIQVLSNLLNNAAKYTERGGRIAITVEPLDDQQVEIGVRDTGAGIAPEMIERVFEMFARADQSLERSQGGLGIGLTLARRLVELHGGALRARSEGAGRGSEFTVRLPLAPAQSAAASLPEADTSVVAPRRVLVVDDNRDAAASLAALLEAAGNETSIACDGEAAIAATLEFRPEVVMLDIGLPKMNGYDVCRAIRRQPGGRDLLVVALTGWGQAQDRARSLEAGFDAHLVKPADFAHVSRVLAAGRRLAASA